MMLLLLSFLLIYSFKNQLHKEKTKMNWIDILLHINLKMVKIIKLIAGYKIYSFKPKLLNQNKQKNYLYVSVFGGISLMFF